MSLAVDDPRRSFLSRSETPNKVCPRCSDRFFTQVGLDEHLRTGDHAHTTRRWVTGKLSPTGLAALQERGRTIAAQNNARRRSCDTCGRVTTPAALGIHQRSTGHTGWAEALA